MLREERKKMKAKSTIRIDELEKEIIVKIPRGRRVDFETSESGRLEPELFFSDYFFPEEIPYEFIGLVEFPDGNLYPKYKANIVSKQVLWFYGKASYENAIDIINKICWWFSWQEGMLWAGSIKKEDLQMFEYESEELSYWLASPGVYWNGKEKRYAAGNVFNGVIDGGYGVKVYNTRECISANFPVRPTMILNSKVIRDDLTNLIMSI